MPEVASAGQQFLLTFIPLFVAIDAVGVLPFVLSLLRGLEPEERRRMLRHAHATAFALGAGFLAIGKLVFFALGITANDFLVAGGLLLLALSLRDIITGKLVETSPADELTVGVVPIGTPLIVGPATLTTLLLLVSQYSSVMVLLAFLVNLGIAWVVFHQADRATRFLGQGGQRAVTKIASLLLAAIAIKMIRQGMMGIISL